MLGSPSRSRHAAGNVGIAVPGSAQFDKALVAERCRRSLYEYCKYSWHVIEPATPLVDNWHIGAIAEHLQAVTEGQITKLAINVPPGHMKSSIVSVQWPSWEWIDRPSEQSIFGSYDIDLALRDSVKCRDIIESQWYRDTFLPDWRMKRDQNAKGYYINTRFGNRYTFGMKAGGKTGWRGNKVVIDDPLSANDKHDKKVKADCYYNYNKVLSTRVNDLMRSAFIVIMQRLADDDLTGHLIREGGYELLVLPAEFDAKRRARTKIGWQDPRTKQGELLFPTKFPREALDYLRIKKLGEEEYAGQYQQLPNPEEGSRFQKENFQHWRHNGHGVVTIKHRAKFGGKEESFLLSHCWIFVTVDLAASEKTQADWTVFSVWAVTPNFNMLLLERYRDQLSEPKIIDLALDVYGIPRYGDIRPSCFVVEDNGLGLPIAQAMQARGIPVLQVHINRVDKVVRSTAYKVKIESGQIFFPDPSSTPWYLEWEREHLLFPGGANDDQVDTGSLAAQAVYEVGINGLKESETLPPEVRYAHQTIERNRSGANPTTRRFFR